MSGIASFFGISVLRLALYAGLSVAVVGAGVAIRQHYVNLGWNKALVAVKKQDGKAKAAAIKVEKKTAKCDEKTGYWDVISQNCKLGDTP